MHDLYELKEKLCDELKDYGSKEVTAASLEFIDKLAHAIKNIDKIIEAYEEEEGYSSRSYPDGMGGSYARRGYSREGGRSYARGRMNATRDTMGRYSGRYSRDDGMVEELRDLMKDAPNESIKHDLQRLVDKIEQM